MFKLLSTGICCFIVTVSLAGCSFFGQNADKPSTDTKVDQPKTPNESKETGTKPDAGSNSSSTTGKDDKNTSSTSSNQKDDIVQVVSKPESIPVLVNKQHKLPDSYIPGDLVFTKIPFIPTPAKAEKREMRSVAAAAVEKLFTGAKKQGVSFLGVSAYRSHVTQVSLFNAYVKRDGFAKARTYSALPGTSEHETGLAIDVTGGDGKCAADDCFGGTKEAKWLEQHAAEYGFIIRYPKGKDAITGYQYEPWHIRYVGTEIAKEIMSRGTTLEEYYNATPVNQ